MFDALKLMPPRSAEDTGAELWALARRAPRQSDLALTGTSRHWLRKLPSRRRPLRLCAAFPRVANRIAWCWSDPALSEQLLLDLLEDRRGGRGGFPACVVRELQRLREFNDQQRTETRPEGFWEAVVRVVGAP